MKIAVVTDSGSNIYSEDPQLEGLFKLPLQITDDERSYLYGLDTNNQEIYDRVAEGAVFKTSLPPLGMIEELFTEIKENGYDQILVVPITSGISSTIPTMLSAGATIGIDVEAVDCYSTAHNELDLAVAARMLFDQGLDMDEVKIRLNASIVKSDTFIIPQTLKQLARSGRITPLASTLAGFLKIKPLLRLSTDTLGKADFFGKVKTLSKGFDMIIENFKKAGVDSSYSISVFHVYAREECMRFVQKLTDAFPMTEIRFDELVAVVGVHTGIGTIAVQYIKKVELALY